MLLQGNSWLFGPCYALLGWYIQVVEKQEQATNKSESCVLPFILPGLFTMEVRSTTREIWWCCLWIHKPWWGSSLSCCCTSVYERILECIYGSTNSLCYNPRNIGLPSKPAPPFGRLALICDSTPVSSGTALLPMLILYEVPAAKCGPHPSPSPPRPPLSSSPRWTHDPSSLFVIKFVSHQLFISMLNIFYLPFPLVPTHDPLYFWCFLYQFRRKTGHAVRVDTGFVLNSVKRI